MSKKCPSIFSAECEENRGFLLTAEFGTWVSYNNNYPDFGQLSTSILRAPGGNIAKEKQHISFSHLRNLARRSDPIILAPFP